MMKKTRREPFTEAEKQYIFDKISEARAKGLDSETVIMTLADELDASKHTVRNTYNKKRKQVKQKTADSEQLEFVETEPVKHYVQEDVKTTSGVYEALGNAVSEGQKEANYQLVTILLDKLEKTIQERDEWKRKYNEVQAENEKIKARVIKEFLT